MSYYHAEELMEVIVSALLSTVPSVLFGIVSYVLTALALYTIAKRRGIHNPWLAWIPVANYWLIGSLSDQYQYVVRGRNCSKRKWLLILEIVGFVLTVAMLVSFGSMLVQMFAAAVGNSGEAYLMDIVMGSLMRILGMCLPLLGVSIAVAVIYFMALYDIYKSMDPANCVLFLVLSILFSVTRPFFLFFNRNKELGMPPRKQNPRFAPEQTPPPQEPWEQDNKDYL